MARPSSNRDWSPRNLLLLGVFAALAADKAVAGEVVEVGKPLPVVSATAATGNWAEANPLEPSSYGSTRGISPATSPSAKVVIYTRMLDRDFLRLAKALDDFVSRHPSLEWSFIQVIDAKGAQRGGYTAEELQARLAELKVVAAQAVITHLSFVVSASSSGSLPSRLGLLSTKTLMVAQVDRADDKELPARFVTSISGHRPS